jgi:glyoxylase-like metal-dependent hydrolase (beta-lactamase superfamily II)
MASAAERSGNAGQLERSTRGDGGQDRSRLLPVLAAERLLRAVLLVGVGLILLTHAHADWADLARRLIGQLGLDPSRNEIGRLISGWLDWGRDSTAGRGDCTRVRNAGGRGGLRAAASSTVGRVSHRGGDGVVVHP